MARTSRSTLSRIQAHPGFSLLLVVHRKLQAATRELRTIFRKDTPVLDMQGCRRVLREALSAVEAVLDLHVEAKPAESGVARRLVRLEPPTISAFAQMRYVLSYALARDRLDNEPEMNWQQHRAYVHSERVTQLLAALLRQHRVARAGGPVCNVGVPA